MAPSERVPVVEDPLAYALETKRMARELHHHISLPWRWVGWYRRRRVVEQRLALLRAMQQCERCDAE
jgi:hypothetical protein